MDLANAPGEYQTFLEVVLAIAAVIVAAVLIRRFVRGSEARADQAADARLLEQIAGALAKRLNVASAQIANALRSPASETALLARVEEHLANCYVTYSRLDGNASEVRLNIEWRDGSFSEIAQSWSWTDVPAEVRRQLIVNGGPVTLQWKPATARSIQA